MMRSSAARLPVSIRETFAIDAQVPRLRHLRQALDLFRNILFVLFVLRWTRRSLIHVRGYGIVGTISGIYAALRRTIFRLFLSLPPVRSRVQLQVSDALGKIEKKLVVATPGISSHTALPVQGWTLPQVREELDKLVGLDHTSWEDGRVSGAVYHGGSELIQLQADAFAKFAVSNPIHPDVFPGVRKMEAEVVSMVLRMFNAPLEGAGVTTSGGTESILMACYGARRKAQIERGVRCPEMIVPDTAHAAFLKAGEYFKIKVHLVKCPGPFYQVDLNQVSRLINSDTILLVGSAPNFPHGIMDDIAGLSKLACRNNIPLHVDCCLGSFLVPYLEKAGFETQPFDFRLKGVTSISCDTHKYGFGPKGSSTLLYRNGQLRAYQYFITAEWPGGVYGSPSMAGSRPGSIIAGCWASMMAQGENGYVEACHKIVGTARRFEAAIREEAGLCDDLIVIGNPLVSVVAFTTRPQSGIDVYDLSDALSSRGWHLNTLQNPPAVHIAFTIPTAAAADRLLEDIRLVISNLKSSIESRLQAVAAGRQAPPEPAKGDSSALYGVAGSLPDKSIVNDLARGFLDTLYKT